MKRFTASIQDQYRGIREKQISLENMMQTALSHDNASERSLRMLQVGAQSCVMSKEAMDLIVSDCQARAVQAISALLQEQNMDTRSCYIRYPNMPQQL